MPDNVMGYQQISQKLDIAIAAGESSFTSLDFCTLFQKECIAIAQPDVTRCGGVTESRRIAELATVFNLSLIHIFFTMIRSCFTAALLNVSPMVK